MALNNCRNFLWVFRRYSSFPGAPKTLEDCYSLFFLDHTCSIEELRAAYTTTVKRYSDSIENVREIDRAYYRILRDLKEAEVVRIREHPEDAAVSSRYCFEIVLGGRVFSEKKTLNAMIFITTRVKEMSSNLVHSFFFDLRTLC